MSKSTTVLPIVPTSGPCTSCGRIVTATSWCCGCRAFVCWRCEGKHPDLAEKVQGHIRLRNGDVLGKIVKEAAK
jgi:hypothetical protein